MVRMLYYIGRLPPHSTFSHLRSMRNDLDQRDFVAIGAGAGVAAAFLAPISGTLFVVEEATSHFSLPLLWRAFSASMIASYTSHVLDVASNEHQQGKNTFHVTFQQVGPTLAEHRPCNTF
eukprot:4066428-Pleurochrysis_carterae.AAC.2